jgi:hypothetical protein
MASNSNNIPQGFAQQLRAAATSDPKKTGVLGALVAVLALMAARTLTNRSGGPQNVEASLSVLSPKTDLATAPARPIASSSLQAWLQAPINPIGRNLFAVQWQYFPTDSSKTEKTIHADTAAGFWSELEKSLSVQADQRDKREALIANYMAQASRLRPQSIMMGSSPKAMINGSLVGEGDVVASEAGDARIEFRVLRIEARRVIVEREGIKLEIPMN